jgi:hypothetical protein
VDSIIYRHDCVPNQLSTSHQPSSLRARDRLLLAPRSIFIAIRKTMIIKSKPLSPKAISTHFQNRFSEISSGSFSNHDYRTHLYFVSVRFEGAGAAATNQLAQFGRLYFKLSRRLLGNNLNRKRRLQPLCYAFLDAEGSRYGSSDVFHCEMPHVHSLMLAPPKYRAEFDCAIRDPALVFEDRYLRAIDVQQSSAEQGSVENLISYCMKGYRQAAPGHFLREDLWSIFPR